MLIAKEITIFHIFSIREKNHKTSTSTEIVDLNFLYYIYMNFINTLSDK